MIVTPELVDCPGVEILKSVETLPVNVIGPATADRAPKIATTTKLLTEHISAYHSEAPSSVSFFAPSFSVAQGRRRHWGRPHHQSGRRKPDSTSRPPSPCSGRRFDSHRRVVLMLGDPFTECSGLPFPVRRRSGRGRTSQERMRGDVLDSPSCSRPLVHGGTVAVPRPPSVPQWPWNNLIIGVY